MNYWCFGSQADCAGDAQHHNQIQSTTSPPSSQSFGHSHLLHLQSHSNRWPVLAEDASSIVKSVWHHIRIGVNGAETRTTILLSKNDNSISKTHVGFVSIFYWDTFAMGFDSKWNRIFYRMAPTWTPQILIECECVETTKPYETSFKW